MWGNIHPVPEAFVPQSMLGSGAQYAPENELIIPIGRILEVAVPGWFDLFQCVEILARSYPGVACSPRSRMASEIAAIHGLP